jgi:hypothetical protein
MAVNKGAVLTVTPGEWEEDPTVTGNWQRDGVNITGATQLTYVVTDTDEGTTLTYRETAINPAGITYASSNEVEVAVSAVVLPTVDTSPVLSYTTPVNIGSVLTATAGSYTNELSVSKRWTRDGATIFGASASTYTVVAADVGTSIRYVETASNDDGSVEAFSDSVIPLTSSIPTTGLRLTVDMASNGPTYASVTRQGATGTYVNSAGTLVEAAANVSRYHYNSAGTFLGLYIEKPKTNLMPGGKNVGLVPPWTIMGAGVTVSTGFATGPTGVASTATRLVVTAGNAGSGIRYAITSGATGLLRNTVYGRSRSGSAVKINMRHPANGYTEVTFNTTWTRVDLIGENEGGIWFNNDFTTVDANAIDVELFGTDVTPGGADYDSIQLVPGTRVNESATFTVGLSGAHDLVVVFDNDATQVIRNVSFTNGAWTLNAPGLERPLVKTLKVYSVGTVPASEVPTPPPPPPPPPPATSDQDWLAVAQTDMRKADGSYSGYGNGRANNDAEWYLRNYVSFSSQSFNAQLTMGRYPDQRAFTTTNPDWALEGRFGEGSGATGVSLWNRIIFWAQLCLNADYANTSSKHANGYTGNSRVMLYDCQIWMKKRSNGSWVRLWHSNTPGGEAWRPHFRAYSAGGYSGTSYTEGGGVDMRTETISGVNYRSFRTVPSIGLDSGDQSLSTFGKTVIPSYWVQHPYGSLIGWDAGDCADICIRAKTSLVLHNSGGTDDRQYHRAMIQIGGDYYAPNSSGGAGGGSYLYGIGTSRAKVVSAIWPNFQYHVMHTKATRADIAADHPNIS